MQGDRHDFCGCIQYPHPTLTEFGQVLLFEQQVPGVHWCLITEGCTDLFNVVANSIGAP
ncbi:hypothetical protein D3C72_2071980 [compost metagenome]